MTLTVAWWLYDQVPDHPVSKAAVFPLAVATAGLPYDVFIRGGQVLRDISWWSDMAAASRFEHQYMVKHNLPISKKSAAHFARTSGTFVPGTARYTGHAGARILRSRGLRVAAKVGARFVPGLGWALLAYDVYTVTNMILDD